MTECAFEEGCPKERCEQHNDSPGPVANDEYVLRVLVKSVHVCDKTGKIKPIAFSVNHLRKPGDGVSVNRKKHLGPIDSIKRYSVSKERPESNFCVAEALVEKIRAFRGENEGITEGVQALCVIDDPDEECVGGAKNKGHAYIHQRCGLIDNTTFTKAKFKEHVRAPLLDLFDLVSPD